MEKINYEDFAKLDMKVGHITKVEDHPNADKLLVLTVDLAEESQRTICAGLKAFYKKEDLEGKKAVFITNLAPRTLRGIESNGMILAASDNSHEKVVFLSPESDIEVGAKIS
jgi:methionyl-tRNA synthetase